MNFSEKMIQLIPPAIILAALGFVIRFFGKVITDQRPYADDRKWDIELSGLWFIFDFLMPPGITAAVLLLFFRNGIFGWLEQINTRLGLITYHWINLAIVLLIWLYYLKASHVISEEKYKPSDRRPNSIDATIDPLGKRRRAIYESYVRANSILLQPLALILALVAGIEVLAGNILWISIFSVQMFVVMVGLAFNYSLMKYALPKVSVYLVGKKQPISDVTLLRINEDTIKVRDKEGAIVINKAHFLKIEFIEAKQEQGAVRAITPLTFWLVQIIPLYFFWNHELWPGILIEMLIPITSLLMGWSLLGFDQKNKMATGIQLGISGFKKTLTDNKQEQVGEGAPIDLSTWTKVSVAYSLVGFIACLAAIVDAWYHGLWQVIVLGFIVPFSASALWNIVGVTENLSSVFKKLNGVSAPAQNSEKNSGAA